MKQHIHYRQGASARCPGSIPVHWSGTVLALLFWLSGPLAYAGEPVILSEGALRPVITVQERNQDKLFAVPGVLAVGVGTLQGTRTPAIHVYMNRTAPAASASALPVHLEGVPVEVIETDEFKAFDGPPGANHRAVFARPVPMGVSTSNVSLIYAGTLGVRVHRIGQSSDVGYITNNHVAAANGPGFCPAQANPQKLPPFGVVQCQPGRLDAPGNVCVAPSIGALTSVPPIIMGNAFENVVDAAFVRSSRNLVNKLILDIGNPSPTVQEPALGLAVRKSGRTTGFTTGTISTINAMVSVNYSSPGLPACGLAKFVGQTIITPGSFSAGGDSGSLILGSTDTSGRRRPVGLLFAGSSTATIANRIGDVLGALHVQVDTL